MCWQEDWERRCDPGDDDDGDDDDIGAPRCRDASLEPKLRKDLVTEERRVFSSKRDDFDVVLALFRLDCRGECVGKI